MILVIGDFAHPVVDRVAGALHRAGMPVARIDQRRAEAYSIERATDASAPWRILGGDCHGTRAVSAVFVRPATAAMPRLSRQRTFRSRLDRMIMNTRAPVVDRPSDAALHYSKPCQTIALGRAGFRVPRTLVTNDADAAREFIVEQASDVVFKGISCIKTVPRRFGLEHVDLLDAVARCPVQFQEFIGGDDYRVTVVGASAFATRIDDGVPRWTMPATAALPADLVRRCIAFTAAQRLTVAGIDLRLDADGRECVFELNPYPVFTHHDGTEHVITRAIVEHLATSALAAGDIVA